VPSVAGHHVRVHRQPRPRRDGVWVIAARKLIERSAPQAQAVNRPFMEAATSYKIASRRRRHRRLSSLRVQAAGASDGARFSSRARAAGAGHTGLLEDGCWHAGLA
jgi:hypothetical protein